MIRHPPAGTSGVEHETQTPCDDPIKVYQGALQSDLDLLGDRLALLLENAEHDGVSADYLIITTVAVLTDLIDTRPADARAAHIRRGLERLRASIVLKRSCNSHALAKAVTGEAASAPAE